MNSSVAFIALAFLLRTSYGFVFSSFCSVEVIIFSSKHKYIHPVLWTCSGSRGHGFNTRRTQIKLMLFLICVTDTRNKNIYMLATWLEMDFVVFGDDFRIALLISFLSTLPPESYPKSGVQLFHRL